MMKVTDTVKHLIIINVIFYIYSQYAPSSYDLLALHFPGNPDFGIWQLATHMFMHAPLNQPPGVMHLVLNMLGLWMFGSPLEYFWGQKKFLFFYFSCGIGAAIFSLGIDYYLFNNSIQELVATGIPREHIIALLQQNKPDPAWYTVLGDMGLQNLYSFYGTSVGASGALYGVIIAYAFMFPESEIRLYFAIPIKAKYFAPGILLLDLFMGIRGQAVIGQGDGVAHFAHLGGALIGFIMMWYWRNKRFNHNRWN